MFPVDYQVCVLLSARGALRGEIPFTVCLTAADLMDVIYKEGEKWSKCLKMIDRHSKSNPVFEDK